MMEVVCHMLVFGCALAALYLIFTLYHERNELAWEAESLSMELDVADGFTELWKERYNALKAEHVACTRKLEEHEAETLGVHAGCHCDNAFEEQGQKASW